MKALLISAFAFTAVSAVPNAYSHQDFLTDDSLYTSGGPAWGTVDPEILLDKSLDCDTTVPLDQLSPPEGEAGSVIAQKLKRLRPGDSQSFDAVSEEYEWEELSSSFDGDEDFNSSSSGHGSAKRSKITNSDEGSLDPWDKGDSTPYFDESDVVNAYLQRATEGDLVEMELECSVDQSGAVGSLASHFVAKGKQVLVFESTFAASQVLADQLRGHVSEGIEICSEGLRHKDIRIGPGRLTRGEMKAAIAGERGYNVLVGLPYWLQRAQNVGLVIVNHGGSRKIYTSQVPHIKGWAKKSHILHVRIDTRPKEY